MTGTCIPLHGRHHRLTLNKRILIPFCITEKAILKYGLDNLAAWVAFKNGTRKNGGIVYKGYNAQRGGKFGYKRATFFSRMAALVRVGLARKVKEGWLLATTREVIGVHVSKNGDRKAVKHRCTLWLHKYDNEKSIKDQLLLKLVEQGHRQKERHMISAGERYKAGKISAKKFCKEERIRLLELHEKERTQESKPARDLNMGLSLGSSKEELSNLAQSGWVPMNTESLMRHTGLGRGQLFKWKKRVKERGLISQVNRAEKVPQEFVCGLDYMQRPWEIAFQGRFSMGKSPTFHQASLYRMNVKY